LKNIDWNLISEKIISLVNQIFNIEESIKEANISSQVIMKLSALLEEEIITKINEELQ
jgi:hypothetical protein